MKVQFQEVIGVGAFGQVFKAAWRGCVVAAKVVHAVGNMKAIENELKV